jgi:putative chitinase
MQINLEQLKRIYKERPAKMLEPWVPILNKVMEKYEINTPQRIRMFLAQIGHESGRLRFVRELWGPTAQQLRYEPPTTLARRLGNTQKGDGEKYMGRGLIQVTGRHNYARVGAIMGLPLLDRPELLEEPMNAAESAGIFWSQNNLNALCDAGFFQELTRRINGGMNGYADRYQLYQRAFDVIK